MVNEKVAFLIVLVRRHRRAVGTAVRRAMDDEVPGAVEEETGPAATGPAAVRRVPPGYLDTLPLHALSALGVVFLFQHDDPALWYNFTEAFREGYSALLLGCQWPEATGRTRNPLGSTPRGSDFSDEAAWDWPVAVVRVSPRRTAADRALAEVTFQMRPPGDWSVAMVRDSPRRTAADRALAEVTFQMRPPGDWPVAMARVSPRRTAADRASVYVACVSSGVISSILALHVVLGFLGLILDLNPKQRPTSRQRIGGYEYPALFSWPLAQKNWVLVIGLSDPFVSRCS